MEVIQTFIVVASGISSLVALIGFMWTIFKFVNRQKEQDKEIEDIKQTLKTEVSALRDELQVITYGILSALDGLKQIGANGNVTDAHDHIQKHMNKEAHKPMTEV